MNPAVMAAAEKQKPKEKGLIGSAIDRAMGAQAASAVGMVAGTGAAKNAPKAAKRKVVLVKNPYTGQHEEVEVAGKGITKVQHEALLQFWQQENEEFKAADQRLLSGGHVAEAQGFGMKFAGKMNEIGGTISEFLRPWLSYTPPMVRAEGTTDAQYAAAQEAATKPDMLHGLVTGIAAMPFNVAGDSAVLVDPASTPEQRSRAMFNLVSNVVGPEEAGAIIAGKAGLTKRILGAFEPKQRTAIRNAVEEARVQGIKDFGVPETPNATFRTPKTEVKPKAATKAAQEVKPEAGVVPEGQGIRHEDIDQLRTELGWELTARGSKTDANLVKEAKKHSGKEAGIAQHVLSNEKRTLTDSEGLALGSQLKALKEQMIEAKAANKVDDFDALEAEAQMIADALDESGSRQGRAFRARRFLARDFDSWEFNRGVEKASMGEPLSAKKQGYRERVAAEVDAKTAALQAERDKAVADYESLLGAYSEKRSKGPMSSQQKRNAALTTLRKLGVPVADAPTTQAGKMASKQSGAINIPIGQEEEIAKGIRQLVRSYADEGAANWGGVMERLQRDLPGIGEEEALFILSGKYKVAKIEADLARKRAYEFMRDVKADANSRLRPLTKKIADVAVGILNTSQRSAQTTLDNSMALIQGKNVLTWKPGTWFKSVGTSLKAITTRIHDPIQFAQEELAKIENHPLYAKAVQAKLALSDVKGSFSKQEEMFAGSLENVTPGLAHSKAMATALMNKMRFDLFRKLAMNAPKDAPAEFYADIARQINIATGKGTGRVADALGDVKAGMVSYAPRYYLSKWQHATLNSVRNASTKAGRREALKMYASQAAGYTSLTAAAQLFGYDVDLDTRSATFGQATAKDGSYSFDLFGQAAEPVRVTMQLLFGRTSRKGNWSDPGKYGSYGIGDYVESKLSPMMRTEEMLRKGTTYDDVEGKSRVVKPSDFWQSWIPLSVKEMQKQGWDPRKIPASFFGANLDKPTTKDVKNPPPPLSWPPPGVKRIREGDTSRSE